MPQRGRDTYYLELFMAFVSSSLALMCLVHAGRFITVRFVQESSIRVPLWVWGVLWLISAVLMAAGVLWPRRKIAQYGSVYTGGLWAVVLYIGLVTKFALSMLTAVAPCFVAFNGLICWYQSRVARANHYGRLSTG
jgi:hypothetical protein